MSLLRIFLLLTLCALVCAVPDYRNRMPNPTLLNSSGLRCPQLGHENCQEGNGTVAQFGMDFKAEGYQWTREFCMKDSDGDGVSNGAELGDPCCVFTVGGTAARSTDLSHPGEPDSKPVNEANHNCAALTGGDTAAGNDTDSGAAPGNSSENGNDTGTGNSTTGNGTTTTNTSTTTNTTNSTDNDPVCFPATAQVTLEGGAQISMEQLRIGERVLVGRDQYSEVFMFTHALRDVNHKFIALHTKSGNVIELTSGHYIYASGELVRAAEVKTGSSLALADGTISGVVKIEEVYKRGLYNPQTVHGDVVVGGVVASTYTEFISNHAAHALLSPLRALYNVFGLYTTALDRGVESYFA